jgi:hypothetical protein
MTVEVICRNGALLRTVYRESRGLGDLPKFG